MSIAELQHIASQVISLSKGDPVSIQIERKHVSHVRLARNSISICGEEATIDLQVKYYKGSKIGTASTNEVSARGLEEVIDRARRMAEVSPNDLEFVPLLEPPLHYHQVHAFDQKSATFDLDSMTAEFQKCLALSEHSKTSLAGFFAHENGEQLFSTSSGLTMQFNQTLVRFSVTARTMTGTRSGKATKEANKISELNVLELTKKAIELCNGSEEYPTSESLVELQPGEYTTILSPSAVADLMRNLLGFMDQRQAAEGRSYFSKTGIGESLFPKHIQLYSDPTDQLAPSKPFSKEGLPHIRTDWITNGKLNALPTDRFWAQKNELPPIPSPSNLILSGGTNTLADMVANTQNGILVAHLWYIRIVDPEQALLTGLTRDGVYHIKEGKITAPIKNLRFNESPVEMLKRAIALTRPERAWGNESEELTIAAPWLKVDGFRFSSVSDAV